LFSFAVRNGVFFQNFGVHKKMNVERAIEKLQKIVRKKETQKNEHR
jgi:hypothetical protein